ncbi:hypothetical protein CYLTODRAFT_488804 [Cylindrobasidium torrendii FP15055 ss-10]|uniref:Uncharacterized protein n=1 Tax=Cylindrobasidium torrendii FP15055 ss-10 TaxID=1314674 RepID=A0A0D7BGE4_9AGAR|nr:hypothetical protein CYLTODRAFT_488804 [Cylindrobasidium torrendii FP15055 ss-10]
MAEAACSAVAATATAKIAHSLAFSSRHEGSHRVEVAETDKISVDFQRASTSGEIPSSEAVEHQELRAESIKKNREYYESIKAYKDTSALNIFKKVSLRQCVRKRKRAASEATQNLKAHYYESSSVGSDTSSITAQSGSPPGSNIEKERIRDWRDQVDSQVSWDQSVERTSTDFFLPPLSWSVDQQMERYSPPSRLHENELHESEVRPLAVEEIVGLENTVFKYEHPEGSGEMRSTHSATEYHWDQMSAMVEEHNRQVMRRKRMRPS